MRRRARGSEKDSLPQRLRALPWAAFARAAVVIATRWRVLTPKERARLGRLVRATAARPLSVSRSQRAELGALIGKLEIGVMGQELLALSRGAGTERPRRRRR